MMADDLITRDELTPRHFGVRYAISAHGATLEPVFDALWGGGECPTWRGTEVPEERLSPHLWRAQTWMGVPIHKAKL